MSTLSLIPPGSRIVRAYYNVPFNYGQSVDGVDYPLTFEGWRDACRAANRYADETRDALLRGTAPDQHVGADMPNRAEYAEKCAKVRAIVDLRWTIEIPNTLASSTDTTVERTNVRHLDEAHWTRCAHMEAAVTGG